MTFLFLIGCKILEDEIVHILSDDTSIERTIIIDNGEISDLVEKFRSTDITPEIADEDMFKSKFVNHGYNIDTLTVVIVIQPKHLHSCPNKLKSETYSIIKKYSKYAKGILLFYGSCGKAFRDINSDFDETDTVIRILENYDNTKSSKVTDCVSLALGGDDEYYQILKQYPKAIFFTPMWASNWDILFGDLERTMKKDKTKKLFFKKMGIDVLAKINTGLNYEPNFEENIDSFASLFGFDIIEIQGNTTIAENCYRRIKNEIFPEKESNRITETEIAILK
ncbi:Protein of unknown function DUF1638 [Methanosalsum zhilinae DSM 4017]|uniref:DUF1638 domain-containing protein n=1 Tax=Methanosalsum zhilinae (strain DSM 4017 / NBRC 107636 / OCM 62 / WeN5) TaxID=679901 RepID=F7XLJ6_METZD|nr:DUF1638 domain-containing protein [Methanosalsum zhilinae]AEH60815.1 Protein of unknown function DUF1638 [Methanosalsum zhilinae DSM 4017]